MTRTRATRRILTAALAGVAANSAGLATAVSAAEIKLATVPVYLLGAVIAALAFAAAWWMVGLIRPQDASSSFAEG